MRLSSFKPMVFAALIAVSAPLLASLAASLVLAAPANEPSAVGLWEQVDEKSGKPESWFRITEKNGVYQGNIVKIFPRPGEQPRTGEWLCIKCEGAERNAPVLGLTLIKGMQRDGLNYENGTIMDPRDGQVYRALMRLSPDGKQLEVRGFLGFAMLGRSQMWNRLPDNALDPKPAAGRKSAPKAAPKN
ncbi:MAG: DUF2147 domain-containing protein [Xanthobacteraceae bacterium]